MIYIIIGWFVCGIIAVILSYKGWNNEFGWSLRTSSNCNDVYPICVLMFFMGFLGIIVVLCLFGRLCFISKRKALEIFDEKHLIKYGYYIGREIAKDEGRLKK